MFAGPRLPAALPAPMAYASNKPRSLTATESVHPLARFMKTWCCIKAKAFLRFHDFLRVCPFGTAAHLGRYTVALSLPTRDLPEACSNRGRTPLSYRHSYTAQSSDAESGRVHAHLLAPECPARRWSLPVTLCPKTASFNLMT